MTADDETNFGVIEKNVEDGVDCIVGVELSAKLQILGRYQARYLLLRESRRRHGRRHCRWTRRGFAMRILGFEAPFYEEILNNSAS
jgi:hypothetical protein